MWRARDPITAVLFGFYGACLDWNKERTFTRKSQCAAMAQCLRNFAQQQEWHEGAVFNRGDARLPSCIRTLDINGVSIEHDYVALDFGSPFQLMELRAFRPGATGYGTKKLADGFWFYTQ
jgi:hypothetical protein